MNEYYLHKKIKEKKKNFFYIFLNHFFHIEPENQEELLISIQNLKEKKKIDSNISDMMQRVIKISKKRIKEIMTPRPKIISLKINYTKKQCLDIIINSSHSRFPIMSHDQNTVEGFVMAKDFLPILYSEKKFSIQDIIRPAMIVPESKYVNCMLKDFQLKHYHLAIVMDEFGIISGLVTIEDILELIVGNIEDEYDHIKKSDKNIQKINKNTFFIKGFTPLQQFNKFFNTYFNDKKISTIGGLILKKCGRIPKKNEIIKIQKYAFKISVVNKRRIIQVHMQINL